MSNKELSQAHSPSPGAFSEAAAFVRELDRQGLLKDSEDRRSAQELTERAYRDTMIAQVVGIDVGPPEELPEDSRRFPGATNPDGTVKFSGSK